MTVREIVAIIVFFCAGCMATEFVVSHFHDAGALTRYFLRIFFIAQYCLIIYLLFESRDARETDGEMVDENPPGGEASQSVADDIEGESEHNE